jgi:glycosyltransferase involved in cell wall biosynthesis
MLSRIVKSVVGSPTKSLAPKGTLGVLAIMKNETDVLREWIEHYRWQGVDKIFLIDNGSTDDPQRILREHIASGFIEFFSRPQPHRQAQHYRDVFRKAGIRRKVEWLVTADLDEFWFSPLGDLKRGIETIRERFDLVYANWIMFGSSGHVVQPPSVREGFVHRWKVFGGHPSTKWICRTYPMRILRWTTHHKVWGIDSRRVISDNLTFRLNHYPIMSRDYFQRIKMTRGDVSAANSDSVRTMDYFEKYDRPAVVRDTLLADMVRRSRGEESPADETGAHAPDDMEMKSYG